MAKVVSYQLNSAFLKIISILCASLVPILVTGPFFPDLIISSLSIWFLYYTLKNKIYKVFQNIYFLVSECFSDCLSVFRRFLENGTCDFQNSNRF